MSILTVSRGTFSGGRSLAECAAEKLGYRCVAREVLTKAAKQYGVDEEKIYKSLVEKPGFLERRTLERIHYTAYIQAALCSEVQSDNVVYHGHAGHLLLKGVPHVLRVRVIASMEQRIKAAMDRQGLGREEAVEHIERVDEGRAKWVKYLYGVDWSNPSLYDLVINLDHVSIDSACDLVCASVNLREFKTTPDSQRIMDDLVVSTEARARIARDGSIGDAEVELEAHAGVVSVGGTVGSLEEADKIKQIVRSTVGVKEVASKIRVRTHW
jgi:cytidylate kinase